MPVGVRSWQILPPLVGGEAPPTASTCASKSTISRAHAVRIGPVDRMSAATLTTHEAPRPRTPTTDAQAGLRRVRRRRSQKRRDYGCCFKMGDLPNARSGSVGRPRGVRGTSSPFDKTTQSVPAPGSARQQISRRPTLSTLSVICRATRPPRPHRCAGPRQESETGG